MAAERELNDLHRAGRTARIVRGNAGDANDARVREDRGVERRRFVGLVGVPEGGEKSWSSSPPSRCSFEHVVEAGVAMLHALGHARGDGVITRFLGRVRHIADERRDAVLLTEFK